MRRRALLASFAVLGTGCVGTGPGSTDESPTTTATGSTSPSASPTEAAYPAIPKPRDDCEAFDLPETTYPALPDQVTESAAKRFATEFEEAYAPAILGAEEGASFDGFDGGDVAVADQTESGILVRVWLALDFTIRSAEAEGTDVYWSTNSRGWYFVAEEFAARARGNGSEVRPERGWVTVACRER